MLSTSLFGLNRYPPPKVDFPSNIDVYSYFVVLWGEGVCICLITDPELINYYYSDCLSGSIFAYKAFNLVSNKVYGLNVKNVFSFLWYPNCWLYCEINV